MLLEQLCAHDEQVVKVERIGLAQVLLVLLVDVGNGVSVGHESIVLASVPLVTLLVDVGTVLGGRDALCLRPRDCREGIVGLDFEVLGLELLLERLEDVLDNLLAVIGVGDGEAVVDANEASVLAQVADTCSVEGAQDEA